MHQSPESNRLCVLPVRKSLSFGLAEKQVLTRTLSDDPKVDRRMLSPTFEVRNAVVVVSILIIEEVLR